MACDIDTLAAVDIMDNNLSRLRLYKSLSAQIRPGAWR